jgi:hypothetical protein
MEHIPQRREAGTAPPEDPASQPGRRLLWLGLLLAAGLAGTLSPVLATTRTKTAVFVGTSTFPNSNTQQVRLYGHPVISGASAGVTKKYDKFSQVPVSTNEKLTAAFSNSTLRVLVGEVGNLSVTVSGSLTVTDWAWWSGTSRVGPVPDPTILGRTGPGSHGGAYLSTGFVTMDLTLANTVKTVEDSGTTLPSSTISYPDFGVGMALASRTDEELRQQELRITEGVLKNVNINSSGALASETSWHKNCKSVYLRPGLSCASESSVTDFVAPLVRENPNDPSLFPHYSNPVTAVVIGTTPGADGQDPSSTWRLESNQRRLVRATLTHGATLTVRVRMLLGAVDVPENTVPVANPTPFRLLFVSRMREHVDVDGAVTNGLLAAADSYPDTITLGAPAAPPAVRTVQPGVTEPQDRQYWAHLLTLYNRSLKAYQHDADAPLRSGKF